MHFVSASSFDQFRHQPTKLKELCYTYIEIREIADDLDYTAVYAIY